MTDNILLFIEQNAEWAALIVFIVAFLESIAIIGLLIPGWLLLVGIGTLIGVDLLTFYPIVIAAYLGAVIGEYLSFLVGYHYHQKVLAWPWVAGHQKLIDKSHEFFEKHGVSGVFFGRFFGPTRAVVPLVAGISEMKKQTFFWVNIVSGLIWAPLYLIPGILIGAAFSLEKQTGYYLIFILTLLAIASTVVWNYSKSYLKLSHRRKGKSKLPFAKVGLSWCILIVMSAIFIGSPYWPLMLEILTVVVEKL